MFAPFIRIDSYSWGNRKSIFHDTNSFVTSIYSYHCKSCNILIILEILLYLTTWDQWKMRNSVGLASKTDCRIYYLLNYIFQTCAQTMFQTFCSILRFQKIFCIHKTFLLFVILWPTILCCKLHDLQWIQESTSPAITLV